MLTCVCVCVHADMKFLMELRIKPIEIFEDFMAFIPTTLLRSVKIQA